jgi:hypothetical protein
VGHLGHNPFDRQKKPEPEQRSPLEAYFMSKILRGLAAGYGAKKLGGCGCGGIIIFIILWYLLGATGLEIFQ